MSYKCKDCGASTSYYDTVKRLVKEEYGKRRKILIERRVCKKCGSIHRLMPEYILPYKHYRKDIIRGFQNGVLSVTSLEYEDYPSESTVRLWLSKSYAK